MNDSSKMKISSKSSVKSFRNVLATGLSLALLFSTYAPLTTNAKAESLSPSVSINEVAWMGTVSNTNGEWMELYNNTNEDISLDGWKLKAKDGTPSIALSGVIKAHGYFLLERTSDDTVKGVTANQIYTGALGNTAEALELYDGNGTVVDTVSAWFAGDNTTKGTMERVSSMGSGEDASNWVTSTVAYDGGLGTPNALNSKSTASPVEVTDPSDEESMPPVNPVEDSTEPYVYEDPTPQHVNHVSNEDGAINIYFSKSALTEYAYEGNEANYQVNLEDQLLTRINDAKTSIDVATYEINLPRIVEALEQKASEGVQVRMVADAKPAEGEADATVRYETMKMNLEKLHRGKDMVVGTKDDVQILSDSPIFAYEDPTERKEMGLPETANDLPTTTVKIGTKLETGKLIVDAERKKDGSYYSPANQMHNKFMNIDGTWVWTGSWNFTITGLYGTDNNMKNNVLEGNQNHSVEMKSPELADVYRTEFEEMFGSTTGTPNPTNAKFHSRKTDNTTHQVNVGGRLVEVYFSPGDGALNKLRDTVKNHADYRTFFTIFSWSDQQLVDELKYKWEGSYEDKVGTRTGFEVKGLFDKGFTNQYWSANIDMQGITMKGTTNNPNTRWANPAPVFKDKEIRKLHAKTMVIDADTDSDPTVVMGSTNWSNNGDAVNDENMVFIHDKKIANLFVQEFYARYKQAGVNPELLKDEVNLLERSKQAVDKAEQSKQQADIDQAKTLVYSLNENNQPSLAERLDTLQAEVTYQALLTESEETVAKAEQSFLQADVDQATAYVVELNEADQVAFVERLDKVQKVIDYRNLLDHATKAVEQAEQSMVQDDVDQATAYVVELDEADQVAFVERLDKVQKEIDYRNHLADATKAVEKAEQSLEQADVEQAMEFILVLNEADQNLLVERLVEVQKQIDYNKKLSEATTAVEKAEQSLSHEDVYDASLVVAMLNEEDASRLTDRLNAIKVTSGVNSDIKVKQAEKEVFLAEKVGNETHLRKSQELVNQLYRSAEKTALQLRLDALNQ